MFFKLQKCFEVADRAVPGRTKGSAHCVLASEAKPIPVC